MSSVPEPRNSFEAKLDRFAVLLTKAAVLFFLFYFLIMIATGGFRAQRQAQTPPAAVTADWLQGSWVRAPTGGEDGTTPCGDFNGRVLYQLNRNTGQIISFAATGEYRALFAYSTPTGNEHSTLTKARWRLSGDQIVFSRVTMKDAFFGEAEPFTVVAQQLSANVLGWRSTDGAARFVRCQGDPSAIYGE